MIFRVILKDCGPQIRGTAPPAQHRLDVSGKHSLNVKHTMNNVKYMMCNVRHTVCKILQDILGLQVDNKNSMNVKHTMYNVKCIMCNVKHTVCKIYLVFRSTNRLHSHSEETPDELNR